MSKRSFPLKDLFRRKFQTGVTVLSLTALTTSTFFLLLFGDTIEFEVALLSAGRLTIWFSYTFSLVLFIMVLLTFITAVLVMSFLASLAMSQRTRDVGIMKAVGCLTDLVFGYFVVEISIMILVSCTAGFVLGYLLNTASISLLNSFGFTIPQKPINVWIIPPAFLALVVAPHFFASRAIGRALMMKPSQALSASLSFEMPSKSAIFAPSKLGLTFRTAYRTLTRRRIATTHAIMLLSIVFTLTTVTVAGGTISKQTMQSYVERAVQENVVLVGHPDIVNRYVNQLSVFSEAAQIGSPPNYLSQEFFIPNSLISNLSKTTGVVKADPRLIMETTVHEIPRIIPDPDRIPPYAVIGDQRSKAALVLGFEPKNAVSDWLILSGRSLNETDTGSTILGDSLAFSLLSSPLDQGIRIFDQDFTITGVCEDPLNNGDVVYLPLSTIQSILGQDGNNLLFIQVDPSRLSQTLVQMEGEISNRGLVMVELNRVLQKHVRFLNTGWSLVTFAPLFVLLSAVLCLSGYMTLLISAQRRDFVILKALGAKPGSVTIIAMMQALIIVFISGAIGLSAGLLISFFLLPERVVSGWSIVQAFLWFLVALAFVAVSSVFPARRAVRNSVSKGVSEP